MLKKITLVLMITLIAVSFSGCSQPTENEGTVNTNSTVASVQTADNTSENSQETSSKQDLYPQLTNSYKVPMQPIYFRAPGYSELEKVLSELFIIYNEKVVAITYDDINDRGPTLQDAHDRLMLDVNVGVENYFKFDPEELKNLKTEQKQMNGYDTIYFEGQIKSEQVKKGAYVVGYSFIANDVPCNITGIVLDVDQSEDIKKEIQENVDAVMMTVEVRNE